MLRRGLLAMVVIGGAARAGRAATVAVVDQLQGDDKAVLLKGPQGLAIRSKDGDEAKAFTKTEYKTPLVITAVVKTDSQNLRLYYGQGMAIFNWEGNERELRFHNPKTHEGSGIKGGGSVPKNTWVTITWTIDAEASTIAVNNVVRGTIKGDFTGISAAVGIGTYQKNVIEVKSLTVTTKAARGGAAVADAGSHETFEPVNVAVSTSPPEGMKARKDAEGKVEESAVERPAYRGKSKALVKSLGEVTGLSVVVAADGDERGSTMDIIGTVTADSRVSSEAGAGIAADVGPEMRTCFKEAVKAVQLRYPYWEPGHIDVSFGEKYAPHEGGSAGTAFGVLMLSTLEGFEVDPKFAVTGDITVDWKVRPVGGITAKLRGAALDGCTAAAIPEGNETAFADMRLMYGDASMWNVQVFSITRLQDAVGLLRVDRDVKVTASMKLFDGLRGDLTKGEREALKSSATTGTLKKILEFTPNCLSAKYLLKMADGTAAKTISDSATIYEVLRILYPFRTLVRSGDDITSESLSLVTTANARRQISALRPMAPAELQSFLNDAMAYVEAINNVAYNHGPAEMVNTKAEILSSRLAAVSSERGFMDKVVREGY